MDRVDIELFLAGLADATPARRKKKNRTYGTYRSLGMDRDYVEVMDVEHPVRRVLLRGFLQPGVTPGEVHQRLVSGYGVIKRMVIPESVEVRAALEVVRSGQESADSGQPEEEVRSGQPSADSGQPEEDVARKGKKK